MARKGFRGWVVFLAPFESVIVLFLFWVNCLDDGMIAKKYFLLKL